MVTNLPFREPGMNPNTVHLPTGHSMHATRPTFDSVNFVDFPQSLVSTGSDLPGTFIE